MNEINQAFGQALRELRLSAKMTQEVLGHEAGLQRNFVSSIELGEKQPSLGTIFKLASALRLNASSLLALAEAKIIDKEPSKTPTLVEKAIE